MERILAFVEPVIDFLNYPLLILGKSSITLSVILFNLFLVLGFLFISSKIKDALMIGLLRIPGLNVGNWRTAITLGYYAVLVFGLLGILQSTGLDMSLFTVLTGAIGIGVGFGMQSIFSNFISGIIILLEKPIKLGDRVVIGEVSGNVKNISVRATTIVTNDNISIIVPNSNFISEQVINWTHSGNTIRISVPVSVAYGSNPDLVHKLLLEVAELVPGVLKSPIPTVRLSEFAENGMEFKLLVWTQEYSDRIGALKSLINFSILNLFRENKINMPFPQRDIYLHDSRNRIETII